MPDDFVSFPLRKDFHLPDDASRSPGGGVRPMEDAATPADAGATTVRRRATAG
jgi:NADH:ubiquinone oxidoreductase subunit C